MGKCDKLRAIEARLDDGRQCLAICAGKHCAKAGTKHIIRAISAALAEAGMSDSITVALTKCQDYCDDAPAITMLPGPYPYIELSPSDAQVIVSEHICNGRPVFELLHKHARRRLKKAQA